MACSQIAPQLIYQGMEYSKTIATDLGRGLYSWLKPEKESPSLKQLLDNQILTIANEINGLFANIDVPGVEHRELTLPRIVVVGGQSSGKSSVLNSIITIDILPVGGDIVTRTPLDIRMHKLEAGKESSVEFGTYGDHGWLLDKKFPISTPTPADVEAKAIRDYIGLKTIEIAGRDMQISAQPIIIQIYSPHVPNLSLVDLPGLIMVACTDRGQAEDAKDQIEALITKYVDQPNTISLLIMQARQDLETDIGMGLVKRITRHDDSRKIIGVITKPDLMNTDTHVGKYLIGTISRNLMLSCGYYVVKNRNNKEIQTTNSAQGIELEFQYFAGHPEYNKPIYRDHVGTRVLSHHLNKILVSAIAEALPGVMTEVAALDTTVNDKLLTLGHSIPNDKAGKLSVLNKYVSSFNYSFLDAIESRGITKTTINAGKILKDTFTHYKEDIHKIDPFTNTTTYDSQYFSNIITSFEGNHMSHHIPPVQILEACMMDEHQQPIMAIKHRSMVCVDDICEHSIHLIRSILQMEEHSHYPLLVGAIISSLTDDIIAPLKAQAKTTIHGFLQNECDYIWTDDPQFMITLASITQEHDLTPETIRPFLSTYYRSIKNIVCHMVPKIIMSTIIREMQKGVLPYLLRHVVTEERFSLLKEDEEVEKQRAHYRDIHERISVIKKIFAKNMKA